MRFGKIKVGKQELSDAKKPIFGILMLIIQSSQI